MRMNTEFKIPISSHYCSLKVGGLGGNGLFGGQLEQGRLGRCGPCLEGCQDRQESRALPRPQVMLGERAPEV